MYLNAALSIMLIRIFTIHCLNHNSENELFQIFHRSSGYYKRFDTTYTSRNTFILVEINSWPSIVPIFLGNRESPFHRVVAD